jgi:hypothetical protein
MFGEQDESSNRRMPRLRALSGVVCRGAGSRAAGEGGGCSMAEPWSGAGRRGGKEGGYAVRVSILQRVMS